MLIAAARDVTRAVCRERGRDHHNGRGGRQDGEQQASPAHLYRGRVHWPDTRHGHRPWLVQLPAEQQDAAVGNGQALRADRRRTQLRPAVHLPADRRHGRCAGGKRDHGGRQPAGTTGGAAAFPSRHHAARAAGGTLGRVWLGRLFHLQGAAGGGPAHAVFGTRGCPLHDRQHGAGWCRWPASGATVLQRIAWRDQPSLSG